MPRTIIVLCVALRVISWIADRATTTARISYAIARRIINLRAITVIEMLFMFVMLALAAMSVMSILPVCRYWLGN